MRRVREFLPPPAGLALLGLSVFGVTQVLSLAEPSADKEGTKTASTRTGSNPTELEFSISEIEQDLAAIVERPLFISGRRPAEIVQQAQPVRATEVAKAKPIPSKAPPPKTLPDGTRLLGLMEENGEWRALVSDSEAERWLALGDTYDGWTITRIDEGGIRVTHHDQTLELRKYDPAGAGG